jgi:anaerobic magnesium-protoporphyrin IX monomethyl ester cyclase
VIKSGPSQKSKIVIGGSGFSMFAYEVMQNEHRIDYGIFLEGEITFPELLEHLEKPGSVRGIFFRENGKVVFSGPKIQVDLTTVSFPEKNLVPLEPYLNNPEAIGVETKRGCALGCIYCIYGFLNGKNYRLKEPVRVVDEIESLVVDGHVKNFTFVDSVFNLPVAHAESICKEIIRRGLKVSWSAWFHEKYLDEEFIDLIRKAGCKKVILSPDGFSDEVLRKLGKNSQKNDILKSYYMLKDIDGIEVCYNFFKNPPGQTLITFFLLIAFYFKAKFGMKSRVHFEFNSIRIEPHTALSKLALEEGIIKENEDLLSPKYYTNPKTAYLDTIFNLIMRALGK